MVVYICVFLFISFGLGCQAQLKTSGLGEWLAFRVVDGVFLAELLLSFSLIFEAKSTHLHRLLLDTHHPT
jgi:hypothetical protein